jgi:hypothetical protein
VSTVNLGDTFNAAVLTAADLDPTVHDPNSVSIDFVPITGNATIRVTRTASIDATQLRELIAEHAATTPPA